MHCNGRPIGLAAILPVIFLASAPSQSADWQVAALGKSLTAWADVASLRRDGNFVKAWVKYVYFKETPVPGVSDRLMLSSRIRFNFECNKREWGWTSIAHFSGDNLDGNLASSVSVEEAEMIWEEAPPETITEDLLEFACTKVSN